jgi:hypothetical protein
MENTFKSLGKYFWRQFFAAPGNKEKCTRRYFYTSATAFTTRLPDGIFSNQKSKFG